ncbi:hypothetical protein IH992_15635 [Candidatus Poribacteria bacterium]|nr:hypothetical protein [Candidatus Poribacteria bacterium]
MLNRLAALISLIFSPFLVPIAGTLVAVHAYARTGLEFVRWSLISIAFSTGLPFVLIVVLVRLGMLSDMHIAIKEQRPGVLTLGLASALCGTFILHVIGAPKAIVWLGITYAINGVVFLVLTQMWKISFHTGVTAGCVTALTLMVNSNFAWFFLLLLPIAWARIYRKRHTFIQAIAGGGLAVIVTKLVLWQF